MKIVCIKSKKVTAFARDASLLGIYIYLVRYLDHTSSLFSFQTCKKHKHFR